MFFRNAIENSLGSAARLLNNSAYALKVEELINTMVHLVIQARREGILTLEEYVDDASPYAEGSYPFERRNAEHLALPLPPLVDLLLRMIVDGNDWNAIESIGANYVMQTHDDGNRYMGVLTIEGMHCVQEGVAPYVAAKRLLSCTTLGDEAAARIMADVEHKKTPMASVEKMLNYLSEHTGKHTEDNNPFRDIVGDYDMTLTDAFVEKALQEAAAVLASDEKKADDIAQNIKSMVLMAENVRRCGIMSLEAFSKTVPCCDALREGVQMAFEGFAQEDIQTILAHKTAVETDAVKRLLGIMAANALTHIVINENPRLIARRLLSLFPAVTDGLRDKHNALAKELLAL